MSQIKFSVITINYNNRLGLQKTIESVIGQSYNNYEYIIIDGASTDGSVEEIKKYISYIDCWISESDRGIYHAMNKGILRTRGEYLIFMNSGDCFHGNDILEWVAEQGLEQDMLIGKVYCIGTGMIKELPGNNLSMMDLYRNHPPHQASFVKKSLFEGCLFDESFVLVADWAFFIDRMILDNCSYKKLDRIIADYNMEGMSTKLVDLLKKEEVKVLENRFPARILKDYEKYKYIESPLLDLIPELNKTAGFHHLIYKFVYFSLWFYKKIVKF